MSDRHDCGTKYHEGEQITIGYDKDDNETIHGQAYTDWTYIIDAMSAQLDSTHDNNWRIWAGDYGMNRIGLAVTALAATLIATVPTLLIAAWSIVYLFVSILLTAFAPLFFLIGIEPGWGRDIFKGWLTKIAENTLRYIMSLLLLLIGFILYGAGLSIDVTDSNHSMLTFGSRLAYITIVTIFLVVYRKDITGMITLKQGTWFRETISSKLAPLANELGWNAANSAVATAAGFTHAPDTEDHKTKENKTAVLTQNAANRIASAKRMYEYSKTVNATRRPYTSISRQVTTIKETRTLKADQQRKVAIMNLERRTHGYNTWIAATWGLNADQLDQLLKTDHTQAIETVRDYHADRINKINEAAAPINQAITQARQRKQNIDTLVNTAATNVGTDYTALSTIAASYHNGDLQADLTGWLAYKQAAIAKKNTTDDDNADALQATLDANKAAYRRITNWSTTAKTAIDRASVQEWNAAHPAQTVKTMNGMIAINNSYQNAIKNEQRDQRNAEQLLKNVHKSQIQTELADRLKNLDSDKTSYSATDIEAINKIYEMTNQPKFDTYELPTVSRSITQTVADATKQTVPFTMSMIEPSVELKHKTPKTKKQTNKKLPDIAKQLGIRTRTLARLQAQGHSAEEIKRAIPEAMKQYPHVSRDQAINQYYS